MSGVMLIQSNLDCANMICQSYLADLTDADLLARPAPGANHISWQLGHLLTSEHGMLEQAFPGSMPVLPAGFAEKYTNDTSKATGNGVPLPMPPKVHHSGAVTGGAAGAGILMYSCSTAASRMAEAMGPASLPPVPPYSTRTANAILGLSAGAKPMNQA